MNRLGLQALFVVIPAVILSGAQRGNAQGSPHSGCESKAIVVNAQDVQKQVPSLKADDFRAKLGGKVVSVASVSRATGAQRVVILLDMSGSINSEVKRRTERAIGIELVRSLPETTQFGLVAFGSRVLEKVEFGHSRAEIVATMDRLSKVPGEGGTALLDAAMAAGDLFGSAQVGDSVVVLSDAQDNHSKTSSAVVERAYGSKGIRMFLVEFSDHYLQAQEDKVSEQDTAELSAGSGGLVRRIARPEADTILSATHEIVDSLSNYYLVQVSDPKSGDKAVSLQLDLVDSSGRRRKDVQLSFPKKYWPCAPLDSRP